MALFHDRGLDETIEALWGMGIGSFRTLVVVVSVCTGRLGSYPLSLGMFSVFRTVDSFDLFVSASNLSFFDFSVKLVILRFFWKQFAKFSYC